jgi:hypothetical protein
MRVDRREMREHRRKIRKSFREKIRSRRKGLKLQLKLADMRPVVDYTGYRVIVQRGEWSPQNLRETRRMLRDRLGSWMDEQGMHWYSGGKMNVEYVSKDKAVRFWMTYSPAFPPEGLLKPTCRVQEENETSYSVVCDV